MSLEAVAGRRRPVDAVRVVLDIPQEFAGDTGVPDAAGSVLAQVEI